MDKHYSVAIYPPENIIAHIKNMKEQLATNIGWFNSKNSVAHITICEFKVMENELEKIKLKLFKIADSFTSFQVHLNHFNAYENGAFFIAPNEDSKLNLKPILKKTQEALQLSNLKKSNDPHISIGRRLTPENLKIASQLFSSIDIDFLCNSIVLREFDPIKKQFFVIGTFAFNGNNQPELIQGSLF